MAKLIIHEAGKDEQEIILEESTYTLGRGEDNNIVLSDEAASRKHACIRIEDGVYVLEDLQSTAGVYVNKEKVEATCSLKAGDHILIGSTKLSFEDEPPAAEVDVDEDETKVLSPDILKKYLEEEGAEKDDTAVFEVGEAVEQTDEEDKTRVLTAHEIGSGAPEPIDDEDKTVIVTSERPETAIDDDRTVIVSTHGPQASTPAYHRLLVVSKEMFGEEYVLDQSDVTLGRSEECFFTIDDSAISSYHARFRSEGEQCFITDMGSSNGTWVNGDRVGDEHLLNDGDEIKLGGVKLRFVHRDTIGTAEELIEQFRRLGAQKRIKMAGIGAAAFVCIILILVVLSSESDQPGKKSPKQSTTQKEEGLVPLAATPAPPVVKNAPIEADKLETSSADLYFDTAQELLSFRLWDEAIEKFNKVLEIDENYPGLDEALLVAQTEAFNRDLFDSGLQMIGEGDLDAGIMSLKGIPEDSVYSAEALLEIQFAQERLPEGAAGAAAGGEGVFTTGTGEELIDQVLKYYSQGDIKIALTKLDTALAAREDSVDEAFLEQLEALKKDITKVQEMYTKGQGEYDKKKYKKAFTTWSEVVGLDQKLVGDEESHFSNSIAAFMADELYRQARQNYEKGNYKAARDICLKALTASPEHEGCREIAGSLGQMAKKIFEEGYILEDLNPGLAVKKWRKVLEICPPDNPYYQKAKSRIARYETP